MSKLLRVLSIIGTRPEAIKMAPVINALADNSSIVSALCLTAQHRQMVDQVLEFFDIQPDYDLDLMKPDQSLAQVTAEVFTNLEPVLASFKPDWILVQGDTTTVMASALSAYYQRIKVGHVEAGLRTGDKWQPYPEEINRRIAGVMADLHFAPTSLSRDNLLREGVEDWRVKVTGNTIVDALQLVIAQPMPVEVERLLAEHDIDGKNKKLVLVTAHRRENFGPPLEKICNAILRISQLYGDALHFIYPVHLNPHVQRPVREMLGNHPHITLTDPLEYLPLVHLEKQAALIMTDSGGIQEEATALGKPTIVLRQVTERPEGIDTGTLHLTGTHVETIVTTAKNLLDNPLQIAPDTNPYGDGHAAGKIVDALVNFREPLHSARRF